MHGYVEVGTCRNDACGQYGARGEDGYCSEDCRIQATGCGVPFCGCGGRCELDPDQDQAG